MAIIKCPECGQEVSDKATACIHCGAPLNVKNGFVKIKCCNIDNNPYKVKIIDDATGEVLVKVPQRGVASFDIKKDTVIKVQYPLTKAARCTIPYEGSHYYEIVMANSFLALKLQINEVTSIDSD